MKSISKGTRKRYKGPVNCCQCAVSKCWEFSPIACPRGVSHRMGREDEGAEGKSVLDQR